MEGEAEGEAAATAAAVRQRNDATTSGSLFNAREVEVGAERWSEGGPSAWTPLHPLLDSSRAEQAGR